MGQSRPTEAMRMARKRRNRVIVAVFFLFIAIVIMIESPLTRVRKMEVVGNRSIAAGRILRDAQLRTGMSLWQVNANHINHLVKDAEPLVQSVHVHIDYLQGGVRLQILQKHVVAVMDVGGKFYPLLNDGVVFGQATGSEGYAWPIISSSVVQSATQGKLTNDPDVALLCEQLPRLSAASLSEISELHLDQYGIVTVYLNNQFEIRCKAAQFSTQMSTGLTAVSYFVAKGYAPGSIDVTGQPPYQYTPLVVGGKAGS